MLKSSGTGRRLSQGRAAAGRSTLNRKTLYITANAAFAVCVLVASPFSAVDAHPLYLLSLFALCSSPILNITRLNDRYALLGMFSFMYFLWYGNVDFIRLLFSDEVRTAASDGIIDAGETLILLGGVMFQLAYRVVCGGARSGAPHDPAKEFPEAILAIGGIGTWILTTSLVWTFKVHVLTDSSVDAITKGLKSLTPLQTMEFMLASYLQPCCIMVLAYSLCRYKRKYMFPVVIAVVFVQFVMGFVSDSKGDALLGILILSVTKVLVDGKLTKKWVIAAIALIALAFPVLQANRAIFHERLQSHSEAAQDLAQTFTQALTATDKVNSGQNRAQTLFERVSVKDNVEVIVAKTGKGVEFQHGYTIVSLLTTFIPRIIWPSKFSVPVGLLVAKEFYPGSSGDVYISPSHLGELYWNFGWFGAAVGMALIGALLGFVGRRFELSEAVTLTRVLVMAVTIQVLVQGFEASIAGQYSVWLRLMLAIWIVHAIFARIPVAATANTRNPTLSSGRAGATAPSPRFSNLMR